MGPSCIFNSLGIEFGPYFSFCCPRTRDHGCESSQVASSIVLISLIGKRQKPGIWLLTCGLKTTAHWSCSTLLAPAGHETGATTSRQRPHRSALAGSRRERAFFIPNPSLQLTSPWTTFSNWVKRPSSPVFEGLLQISANHVSSSPFEGTAAAIPSEPTIPSPGFSPEALLL